jgi:hypothetical protein
MCMQRDAASLRALHCLPHVLIYSAELYIFSNSKLHNHSVSLFKRDELELRDQLLPIDWRTLSHDCCKNEGL